MSDWDIKELDPRNPKRHLTILHTPFGNRSVYDSVSFCNRCGSCQQACPTYLLTSQETFSPRGRNQAVRLIAEGKLSLTRDRTLLAELANSCLLCGRCTQACAGKIPTAEHMLELRRALSAKVLPALLHRILSCRGRHPTLFKRIIQAVFLIRRLGGIRLLRLTGITRLKSFCWIAHADDILPRHPKKADKKYWAQHLSQQPQEPQLIYLPSLEAQWLWPELGTDVLKLAASKKNVQIWDNQASGLFEYIYGDVRQSRRLVRNLIKRHQQTGHGKLPLLTDSVDVFLFLRRAPQLFSHWPTLQKQAQHFSEHIIFVTELLSKKKTSRLFPERVSLDSSALFAREEAPFEKAQQILKTQFKKNFVECCYKNADTPAFGYCFVQPDWASQIMMKAVREIARTQTGTVFTLSGLSALELNFYLKRFYPTAQADHLARLHG